jgi:hypothetical protein
MRHVDKNQLRRLAPQRLFDDLENARQAAAALETEEGKRRYIEQHGAVCTAFRPSLWTVGCLKCWYSEAKLMADDGEVEHFRPKRRVWKSQPPHGGYLWSAFDWRNFRLAHRSVNLRRTDYSTEQKAGKGCYFPLRHEDRRARVAEAEEREEPVLLDPAVAGDCILLCFDDNSGKPIPVYSKEADDWRHRRAADSINYYHLDEGTWNAQRADLMRDVTILCERVLAAAAAEDRDKYNELVGELLGYIGGFAEFSTAAAQVVSQKGILIHVHPGPEQGGFPAHAPAAHRAADAPAEVDLAE